VRLGIVGDVLFARRFDSTEPTPDLVVPFPADDPVVAALTQNMIVAVFPFQKVVACPAPNLILAIATINIVVAGPAFDRVVTRYSEYKIARPYCVVTMIYVIGKRRA
jgi:hypothetical protein